ncbi:MAG: prepilin-type N-terminal cleavage/methylation domain-containing protein [bacterium]
MLSLTSRRTKGHNGFSLIELLVAIGIIAILVAIAIPIYLGQREKAQDSAAKSVVRNAMIAVESAYVDTRDFSAIVDADLTAIEVSMAFIDAANAATAPTADAEANEVNWRGTGAATYEVGSLSRSGKTFGAAVDKDTSGGNTFYVDGAVHGW